MNRPTAASQSKLIPILAVLTAVALVAGIMVYQKFFRKEEVVEAPKVEVATNTVMEVKANVDLFPGRRNAHGIFYVPVKQAQDTVAVLAANAAAATNQASQAQGTP